MKRYNFISFLSLLFIGLFILLISVKKTEQIVEFKTQTGDISLIEDIPLQINAVHLGKDGHQDYIVNGIWFDHKFTLFSNFGIRTMQDLYLHQSGLDEFSFYNRPGRDARLIDLDPYIISYPYYGTSGKNISFEIFHPEVKKIYRFDYELEDIQAGPLYVGSVLTAINDDVITFLLDIYSDNQSENDVFAFDYDIQSEKITERPDLKTYFFVNNEIIGDIFYLESFVGNTQYLYRSPHDFDKDTILQINPVNNQIKEIFIGNLNKNDETIISLIAHKDQLYLLQESLNENSIEPKTIIYLYNQTKETFEKIFTGGELSTISRTNNRLIIQNIAENHKVQMITVLDLETGEIFFEGELIFKDFMQYDFQ